MHELRLELEPEAVAVLERLHDNGFEAYLVGGFVRDSLLGRPTQDIDIATSAEPDEVISLFEHTAPTGLKHGTVTVLINHKAYEVTTFRTESDYEQHRRPREVVFVRDLYEDLKRRDFTINAMALSREGKIIDPFSGWDDLREKRIRCVGSPYERFQEDALRMMRAIRFAANYRFEVEQSTWEALIAQKSLLQYIAMERIYAEWSKMMEERGALLGLKWLVQSGLLSCLKQPLEWPIASWQRPDQLPKEWTALQKPMNALERWALLAIGMQLSAKSFQNGAKALTMPSKSIRPLSKLLQADQWVKSNIGDCKATLEAATSGREKPDAALASSELAQMRYVWNQALLDWGAPVMLEWAKLVQLAPQAVLLHLDEAQTRERLVIMAQHGQAWTEQLSATQINELNIGGRDLTEALRRKEGRWIGELLGKLLSEVVHNQLPNDKESLLNRAKSLLKSDNNE